MESREGRKCLRFGRRIRRKVKTKCVRFEIKKTKLKLVVLRKNIKQHSISAQTKAVAHGR